MFFRIDLTLELIDKEHISKVKVAKILSIIGKRLELRYYDDEEQGKNFFLYTCIPYYIKVIFSGNQFFSSLVRLHILISKVCSLIHTHKTKNKIKNISHTFLMYFVYVAHGPGS